MSEPYFADERVTLWHGDCLDVLAALPDASVDSIVTDPPYGLGFMGKEWDDLPPGLPWAQECLRVLKPGGHLLAFGGTRTAHRLACAVEDAGFEIRDGIAWLYGSGFPKSLDVSKAIDRAAGVEREVVGSAIYGNGHVQNSAESIGYHGSDPAADLRLVTAPTTDDARTWQGWGTALKPAFEPVVVGRKPLIGTVAANVLAHGTGALNIDATRVATTDKLGGGAESKTTADQKGDEGWTRPWMSDPDAQEAHAARVRDNVAKAESLGRWPANVVLDASQAEALDEQSGTLTSGLMRAGTKPKGERKTYGQDAAGGYETTSDTPGDSGGASRFFYVAKASTAERPNVDGIAHPTVKPLTLMRWLVRLVTPPAGTVLEPFAGSGTTVEACVLEGFRCIAIEREADYLPLILDRLAAPGAAHQYPAREVKAADEYPSLLDFLDEEPA